MAERLKEILNADLHVSNMVGSKLPLLTTDATTQYVINDFSVVTALPSSSLEVNGRKVADISTGEAFLSGRELVDTASSLDVAMPFDVANHATYKATYLTANTDVIGESSASVLGALSQIEGEPQTHSGSSAIATSMDEAVFADDGSFYYTLHDGNSSTKLRRREGGVSGAETTIQNSGYKMVVFDGMSRFYWFETTTSLSYHDINTNTTGTLTLSGGILLPASGSNTRACICNGIFFYSPSNGYTSDLYYVDLSTGNKGRITGFNVHTNFNIGGSWALYVTHDVTTDRFGIVVRESSDTLKFYRLLSALPLDGETTYTLTTGNCAYSTIDANPAFKQTSVNGRLRGYSGGHKVAYRGEDGSMVGLELENGSTSVLMPATVLQDVHATTVTPYLVKTTAASLSTYDAEYSFGVRVSGVEITGVS